MAATVVPSVEYAMRCSSMECQKPLAKAPQTDMHPPELEVIVRMTLHKGLLAVYQNWLVELGVSEIHMNIHIQEISGIRVSATPATLDH